MKWWENFRKYFIPCDENEHQPYFLREWNVLGLLMLIVLMEGVAVTISFFVLPRSQTLINALPEATIGIINQERQRANLNPLALDQALSRVAADRAQELATKSEINAALSVLADGEYRAVNFFDAEDLSKAWQNTSMEGPLLAPASSKVGLAVVAGRYQDRAAVYAVALLRDDQSAATSPWEVLPPPRLSQALDAAVGVAQLGFWTRLATALHALASQIYLVLMGITVVALLLNLFVSLRIQHLTTIVNGLLLILLLSGVLYINNYLFTERIVATYLQSAS